MDGNTISYHKPEAEDEQVIEAYTPFNLCVSSRKLNAAPLLKALLEEETLTKDDHYILKEIEVLTGDSGKDCAFCSSLVDWGCQNEEVRPQIKKPYSVFKINVDATRTDREIVSTKNDDVVSYPDVLKRARMVSRDATEAGSTMGYVLEDVLLHESFYNGCQLSFQGQILLTDHGIFKAKDDENTDENST